MMTYEKPRILLVDDEVGITKALTRIFRRDYDVTACDSGKTALHELKENDYAVILSDMCMPNMDGATFLSQAKKLQPQSVRLLLTGHSDMDDTIRAINEGQIFNYITKPWDQEQLKEMIKKACEQYSLQLRGQEHTHELAAKNQLLQQVNEQLEESVHNHKTTLNNSQHKLQHECKKQKQMFQQVLDMVNTIIQNRTGSELGHNKRIAFQSRLLAEQLGLDRLTCTKIYLAGLLADLGKVSLSDELLSIPEQQMDSAQRVEFQQHVLRGAQMLKGLPDLGGIAHIIKHQLEHFSGGGFPDRLKKDEIPIGSRILHLTKDYDRLLQGLKLKKKQTISQARQHLLKQSGHIYDPKLLETYLRLLTRIPQLDNINADYAVSSESLNIGNVLAQDVLLQNGNTFLSHGTVLTQQVIERIRQHENKHGHQFTFFIN